MSDAKFEWTSKFWQGWRESANPYRQYKSARDRQLAVQLLDPQDDDRILEIGCGYGWISQALWASARVKWVGLDRSDTMLTRLCSVHPNAKRAVLLADACRLPFNDEKFDKVLCTGVLMHIGDYATAFQELVRVLRPGGVLLCSFNNALSPWAVPVRLWNHRKSGFVQEFLFPATFRRLLHDANVQLDAMAGDGIIATVPVSVGRFRFPPAAFQVSVCKLDQWLTRRLPGLAYEIWVRGVKGVRACAF